MAGTRVDSHCFVPDVLRAGVRVLEIESNVLWMRLMPMQIVGIGIALFTAVFWGFVEKKRGAGIDSGLAADDCGISGIAEEAGDHSDLVRPGMFWFNVCLTLFIIVCLIWLPILLHLYAGMRDCAPGQLSRSQASE